jgi:hypothetical protein
MAPLCFVVREMCAFLRSISTSQYHVPSETNAESVRSLAASQRSKAPLSRAPAIIPLLWSSLG